MFEGDRWPRWPAGLPLLCRRDLCCMSGQCMHCVSGLYAFGGGDEMRHFLSWPIPYRGVHADLQLPCAVAAGPIHYRMRQPHCGSCRVITRSRLPPSSSLPLRPKPKTPHPPRRRHAGSRAGEAIRVCIGATRERTCRRLRHGIALFRIRARSSSWHLSGRLLCMWELSCEMHRVSVSPSLL